MLNFAPVGGVGVVCQNILCTILYCRGTVVDTGTPGNLCVCVCVCCKITNCYRVCWYQYSFLPLLQKTVQIATAVTSAIQRLVLKLLNFACFFKHSFFSMLTYKKHTFWDVIWNSWLLLWLFFALLTWYWLVSCLCYHNFSVVWCGLRLSVLGQDRSQTKTIGLGLTRRRLCLMVLVLQVWCRVVKHSLVTLVVIMILKDTATFQVLFIVSLFCAWNITTVEISKTILNWSCAIWTEWSSVPF